MSSRVRHSNTHAPGRGRAASSARSTCSGSASSSLLQGCEVGITVCLTSYCPGRFNILVVAVRVVDQIPQGVQLGLSLEAGLSQPLLPRCEFSLHLLHSLALLPCHLRVVLRLQPLLLPFHLVHLQLLVIKLVLQDSLGLAVGSNPGGETPVGRLG